MSSREGFFSFRLNLVIRIACVASMIAVHASRACFDCPIWWPDRSVTSTASGTSPRYAYVLLEVVEDRAVEQFPRIAAALERVDPESAATVRSIWEDEKRHVLYARAINKRYAPSPEELTRALARVRAVEQQAFDDNGAAFLRHALDEDLLALHFPESLLWRAMSLAA